MRVKSEGVTVLLDRWKRGDRGVEDALISLVYQDLRRAAAQRLALERRGHSLQATELRSELFLRLFRGGPVDWRDRNHLFSNAARTIRNILVDHARRRRAQRRPNANIQVPLEDVVLVSRERPDLLLQLDDALAQLTRTEPRQAQIIEMYAFMGMTVSQIAQSMGICERTVIRDLSFIKSWLSSTFGIGGCKSAVTAC